MVFSDLSDRISSSYLDLVADDAADDALTDVLRGFTGKLRDADDDEEEEEELALFSFCVREDVDE